MAESLIFPGETVEGLAAERREKFALKRLYGAALLESGIVDDLNPPQVRKLIEHAVDWWLKVIDLSIVEDTAVHDTTDGSEA